MWRFQLPYRKLFFPEYQYSIFGNLWCVYLAAHTVCQGLLLLHFLYKYFILRLSCKIFGQGNVKERLISSLGKFYGPYWDIIKHYEVPLSQMLYEILVYDHIQWQPQLIRHFTKSWPCYRTVPFYRFWRYYLIPGVEHRTFATGVSSQQRMPSPLDTSSSPFWYLHLF